MKKPKIEPKRFEGLNAIVGNPGKGKTYFLQKLALQYMAKGYIVVLVNCGWSIQGAVHIETAEELLTIHLNPNERSERLAVFADEMNSLLPARDFKSTSHDSRDYFAMYRHAGVSVIYYCTQDFEDVEKILRSKTEFVWRCGFVRPIKLFYHRKFSKSDFVKLNGNQPVKPTVYAATLFFARTLPTSYDTYARYDYVSSLAAQNEGIANELARRDMAEKAQGESRASAIRSYFSNFFASFGRKVTK